MKILTYIVKVASSIQLQVFSLERSNVNHILTVVNQALFHRMTNVHVSLKSPPGLQEAYAHLAITHVFSPKFFHNSPF